MKFPALFRCRLTAVFALLCTAPAMGAPAARSDAIDDTVAAFFRPYRHDTAALAPDGRHVALSENLPGRPPAIAVVAVDDRSVKSYTIDDDRGHAVRQILWVSPTRLVFTTHARAVGTLDLASGEIAAVLVRRDLDTYAHAPELGQRRYTSVVTPDMSADTFARGPGELPDRQILSPREALAQARVTGDLFSSDSKAVSGHLLRPFLLGAKPGAPHLVQIELRDDADLLAYRTVERQQLTVPGNAYIVEPGTPPPNSPEELGGRSPMIGEMATYEITRRLPPLVLLELDALKGRTRELLSEDDWRRVWLDRTGRARVALEQRGRGFRYLYRGTDTAKWVPLDSLAKGSPALGFSPGPATLLGPRSVPLGFDARGEKLFVASNVGGDTFTLRVLDLAAGRLEEFEVGHKGFDLIEPTALAAGDAIRLDPHTGALAAVRYSAARRETTWFAPDMQRFQAQLSKQLAPRRVELLEWNADRSRFLVEATAPDDPGAFFLVDAAAGKIVRCGDRAPWLDETRRNTTHAFDFKTPDGRRIAGWITQPRVPRLKPPPMLVYFHDGPWFADTPLFNRGAQALAALGFAVLQLNHRGSGGLGRAHLHAAGDRLDLAVLEDVRAVLALGQDSRLGINTRMVAALGHGIGGYLAVRMAQLAPETFRCAVAINAPGDLDAWRTHPEVVRSMLTELRPHVFGTDREKLRAQSALAAAPGTRAPVLVVHGEKNTYVPISLGRELHRALQKGSPETAFLELPDEGHSGWSEQTTAKLFAELGRFFNATIYNFGVELRKPEVVK